MFIIWNAGDMETVVSRATRAQVVSFVEETLDIEIVQHGPAGESRFRKAVKHLANFDFEVYKILGNELVK